MASTLEIAFGCGASVELPQASVLQMFEVRAAELPESIALEMCGKKLSYRELNENANRLAHHLRQLGVGPDALVGISLDRSFDMVIAIYGILKAGGAYVPLDPAYPTERLQYMVGSIGMKHLVTQSDCMGRLGDLNGIEVVCLDKSQSLLQRESSENPEPLASEGNLVYAIFTSGSTGQPKAAGVYHRGFTNLVQWFVSEFSISSSDHALLVSSLSFDLTQKNLFATLIAGGTLHLQPPGPYDIKELSRLIFDHGITLLNCTPSAFYPLIEPFEEKKASMLASLRVVFLGGEPISIARIKPWLTHFECQSEIANTYGPTECTDICGFYRLNKANIDRYDFVPLGGPIHNVQLVILDTASKPCAIGEPGELCVAGAGVGVGYLNDSEMTQQRFVRHHFSHLTSQLLYRTGDQSRWHTDGVVEFLGRLDYQVKIRGHRIELTEIERSLETHPAVKEAIVLVKSDDSNGDPQMVACFTTREGMLASQVDLRCHLAHHLPAHMSPNTFEPFSSFPLSPNGKVDRRVLAELVRDRQQSNSVASVATASSSLEESIRSAWCQVLDRDEAHLDANFFDLGGDSIRLARLHQKLETLLQREFPIIELFSHPTIRSMTDHLGDSKAGLGNQALVRDRARLQREAQAARRRVRG
jgi:amino acid adenylation domain-containing protein